MAQPTTKTDPYLASLQREEINTALEGLSTFGPQSLLHQLIWQGAAIGALLVLNVPFNGIGYKLTYAIDNWLKQVYDENEDMRLHLVRTVAQALLAQFNLDSFALSQAVIDLMQQGGFVFDGERWAKDGARWVFPVDAPTVAVCYPDESGRAVSRNFGSAQELEHQLLTIKNQHGHYLHPNLFK